MEAVSICQEMGWTYDEYVNNPTWFLELLKSKYLWDSERMKKESDRVRFKQRHK